MTKSTPIQITMIENSITEIDFLNKKILLTDDFSERFYFGLLTKPMMRNIVFSGANHLDIGSGSGICGIFSLLSGARETSLVDLNKHFLSWADKNLKANNKIASLHLGCISAIPESMIQEASIITACLPQIPETIEQTGSSFTGGAGDDGLKIIDITLKSIAKYKTLASIYIPISPLVDINAATNLFSSLNFSYKLINKEKISITEKQIEQLENSYQSILNKKQSQYVHVFELKVN